MYVNVMKYSNCKWSVVVPFSRWHEFQQRHNWCLECDRQDERKNIRHNNLSQKQYCLKTKRIQIFIYVYPLVGDWIEMVSASKDKLLTHLCNIIIISKLLLVIPIGTNKMWRLSPPQISVKSPQFKIY